jgi:hypothetical protein
MAVKDWKVVLLGGDFKGIGAYTNRVFHLTCPGKKAERIPVGCCKVEPLTAESSKSMGGALLAGAAGGLVLGPAGLVAGALAGGNKQLVSFVLETEDGRKTVGQAHPTLFATIVADGLTATCVPEPPLDPAADRITGFVGCGFVVLVIVGVGAFTLMTR